MLRTFDIVLSVFGLIAASPLMVLLAVAGLFDTGSPLFRQVRVGRYKRPYTLIKFRTMRPGTVQTATHLVEASAVTFLGGFLRRTKLDELPQLWNVLKGEMSLVGPRPCLPTQHELIEAREALGVFTARPGITGLAQITGIDMSSPRELAETDAAMLRKLGVSDYLAYLFRTACGTGFGDRVKLGND